MEVLDKHFRTLTRAAFQRYGFAYADLVGRWAEIAGERFGTCSEPLKISWPRRTGEQVGLKTGGTLVLRAAAGRGLEVQHEAPQILEKVNRFFGYSAIGAIRIIQDGSWFGKKPEKEESDPVPIPFPQEIAEIANDDLRAALERLGAGVAGSAKKASKRK